MRTLTAEIIDELTQKLGRRPERNELETWLSTGKLDEGGNGACGGWQSHKLTQADIFAAKLPPLEYLVEGLIITPGLSCLGGKKKVGKSWLALDLAQRVASGTPFLGKQVRRGKVLYLSLEDGLLRLQQRLQRLHSDSNLQITYITSILPLNSEEGMIELEDMIKAERPALCCIDTLASAKNRKLDENKAGDMADLMNWLHDLALTYNTVILVVLHFGKKSYGDIGFDYRGSSATPSATDANLGLYRNSDGSHDLKVEGRDFADFELRLYFDPETWCFQLKGDSRDERRAIAEDSIIEAIEALGGEADAAMIAGELGLTRMAIQHHCQRMRKDKLLDFKPVPSGKTKKFVYSLPETGLPSLPSLSPLNTDEEDNDIKSTFYVDNKDNKETPVSEVETTIPKVTGNLTKLSIQELPVEVVKSLGNISG